MSLMSTFFHTYYLSFYFFVPNTLSLFFFTVPSNGASKGKKSSPVAVSMLVDTKPDSKPSLLTPMESVTIVEGDDIIMKAQFDGSPPLEFTWFKDELALIESPRIVEEVEEGNWAVLKITKARIEDEAEYVCIAANEFGGCETSAELLVDGKLLSF